MDYPFGVVLLSSNSTIFGRLLREMCSEYHPENEDDERWYLPVDGVNVPVFITSQSKATYPEIRLHPFFDEDDMYMGYGTGHSVGDEIYGEDPGIDYLRARTDVSIRRIRSHIDIYAKNLSGVVKIRDALVERLIRFRIAEARNIKELDEDAWVEIDDDTNVYINANFDINSSVISVYDVGDKLSKTDDVENTSGSWNLTNDGLVVNPKTTLDNISMNELVTNGLVFTDGSTIGENGILNIKVVRSQPQKVENPHLRHWTIHTLIDYKQKINTEYTKSYEGVITNVTRQ